MKKRLQNGFAHPGLILLLLIVVAVALIGYKVEQNHNKASVASIGAGTPVTTHTVGTIQSKADLNSAEASLSSQNIDGDLNPGQYNQDVNSLL